MSIKYSAFKLKLYLEKIAPDAWEQVPDRPETGFCPLVDSKSEVYVKTASQHIDLFFVCYKWAKMNNWSLFWIQIRGGSSFHKFLYASLHRTCN